MRNLAYWAISSEVEHYLDTVGVTGSIPVSPIPLNQKESLKAKILVVGLGRSGIGAAKLLKAEGYEVVVLESATSALHKKRAVQLRNNGITVELGKTLELQSFLPWIERLDSVVVSPGIPWNHKTLNELRRKGILIKGEISLAWEKLKGFPWIGITGTNGKTTVTHMLKHIFESNQIKAPIAGNVGNSAAELALTYQASKEDPDWLIMELSSYQLETAPEISPKIGIWTNLTPDHLERHGSLEAYNNIKRRLLENSEIPIYNSDDSYLRNQRAKLKEGIWVSTKEIHSSKSQAEFWINNQGMIMERNQELYHSSTLSIPGIHNKQNLLLATAAARYAGLSASCIESSIQSFAGVPHRLEKLGDIAGISIFNDSKATNYESATMGLMAVPPSSIILAGGQAKEGDSSKWLKEIKHSVCGIILFGECASQLKELINLSGYRGEIKLCENLDLAVEMGIKMGIQKKAKNILLSPACASFDQYNNYEERGNHFKEIISEVIISKKNLTGQN